MVTADELRPKWGLLAEYIAFLQNMTEAEYREYQERKRYDRATGNYPKDLKTLAERRAEMTEEEKRNETEAICMGMMGFP